MRKALAIILVFFISVAAWNAIDLYNNFPLYSDSGAFASGAFHFLKGRVLYKEIWENKQPMIYVIDGLALWLFGINTISIRIAERIFAVMGVLLIFLILQKIYKNLLLSFTGCLLFIVHFYQLRINEAGNFTEEYAAIFIPGGIACSLYACESTIFSQAFCFGAGIFFSAAAFTKEPFILSSIPWFFYLIFRKMYQGHISLRPAVTFICGALVPFSILLIYFLSNGAMSDWLDLFSHQFGYTVGYAQENKLNLISIFINNLKPAYHSVMNLTITGRIAFVIGLLSVFYKSFLKKYNYLPLVFIIAFLMDYLGTLISGRCFTHYFMQFVAAYILVGMSGFALLADLTVRFKKYKAGLFITVFIIPLLLIDHSILQQSIKLFRIPCKQVETVPILVQYIKQHSTESDFIWDTTSDLAYYYLAAQRFSPTKFLNINDGLFINTYNSTVEEKIARLREDLNKNPPKFIIGSDMSFLKSHDLLNWLYNNYSKVPITDYFIGNEINLYVHNNSRA